MTAATFLRNAQLNKGCLYLLNGFSFVDERIAETMRHFLAQIKAAPEGDIGFLVQDLRVAYMSNKEVKKDKVPLALNCSTKQGRVCLLKGILDSISLLE